MTMMLVADLSLFHSRHNMSTIDEDEEMKADHSEIEKHSIINPWEVSTVTAFSFFCCPECNFRTKDVPPFLDHAIEKHPQAKDFCHQQIKSPLAVVKEEPTDENHEVSNIDESSSLRKKLPRKQKLEQRYISEDEDMYDMDTEELKYEHPPDESWEEEYDYIPDEDEIELPLKEEIAENDPKKLNKPKRKRNGTQRRKDNINKERNYQCNQCDFKTITPQALETHKTKEHDGYVKCVTCNKEVIKSRLEGHTIIHSEDNKDREKDFLCPKCPGKVYTTKARLEFHYLRSHLSAKHRLQTVKYLWKRLDGSNRQFHCEECEYKATSEAILQRHIVNYHGDSDWKLDCPNCSRKIPKERLEAHLVTHSEENSRLTCDFLCPKCPNKVYKTIKRLEDHYFVKHMTEWHRYRCDQCPKVFAHKSAFDHHVNLHHSEQKNHLCETCGKSFGQVQSLEHHLKTTSKCNKSLKLHCDICKIDFETLRPLIDHYEKEHDCPPPNVQNVCPHCAKSYLSRGSLKSHILREHEGNDRTKNYMQKKPCPHCGKELKKRDLEEHIKVKHENSTPFECDECNRKYGTETKLKTHKFNVHQRVKCEICGHAVCNTFWLRRHMHSAHGVVPKGSYKCEHCPSFFKTFGNLENHLKKNHANVIST